MKALKNKRNAHGTPVEEDVKMVTNAQWCIQSGTKQRKKTGEGAMCVDKEETTLRTIVKGPVEE